MEDRYSELLYPGKPYRFTHPDRLACLARLYGLDAPNPETARILELGCGDAENILPIAYSLPHATVVGLDISARPLEPARACAEALGLNNLTLRVADILDLSADDGPFDYIIAHGVFSWVPEHVRARMLAFIGEVLSENGVAFISFNTYPGWHMRHMGQAVMRWHASSFESPPDQVAAGREVLNFVTDGLQGSQHEAYARVMEEVRTLLSSASDAYIYHDILAPICDPFYFSDFAGRLDNANLQYVSEASYSDMLPTGFPESFQQLLTQVPDMVAREQLIDLMRNTMFRRSLVCRKTRGLNQSADPAQVESLRLVMLGTYVGETREQGRTGAVFEARDGRKVTIFDPTMEGLLRSLQAVYPKNLSFDEALAAGHAAAGSSAPSAPRAKLAAMVLQLYAGELVELETRARSVIAEPEERPLVTALARHQVDHAATVTNLFHEQVNFGAFERLVISLCDGTRTVDEILDATVEAAARGDLQVTVNDAVPETQAELRRVLGATLPERLQRIGELGLYEHPDRRS